MSSRVPRFLACLSVILACWASAGAAERVEHRLDVALEPDTGLLRVTDEISLGDLADSETVELLLNAVLEVTAATPELERVPLAGPEGFFGINGSSFELSRGVDLARYRLVQPAPGGTVTVSYEGHFDFGLSDQKEEYTRGFRDTAGIVSEEGLFLSGAGFWYPYFSDGLVEFEVEVELPDGWRVISQGSGTSRDDRGRARWSSGGPMDEIYLVGGPLVVYEEAAGAVTAQVYLRGADEGLAAKYLTATAQYIEMYRGLIGPYPYEKFALIENFWETGYGMPSFTLLGPTVIRFPFILTSSYPHEILHNWWGNSVFVDYQTGNWSEGLTAYLADHLIQEQRGTGSQYRRATLQKYRNYVLESRDFPLSEFRSRHSAATEAVGYGKTLMGFHMLRRHVGDETFRQALATLYRRFRGRRAAFWDLQAVFEEASGETLGWFFQPWVERPGAVSLEVEVLSVEAGADPVISGVLRQRQPAEPFALVVPVVVQTTGGATTHIVRSIDRVTPFELTAAQPPVALQVDPEFDVFRLLDAREIPPSIGQIFGEPEILALLPARAEPAALTAYRELVEAWQSDSHRIVVRLDEDVEQIPADRSVWILGRENRHRVELSAARAEEVELGEHELRLAGEEVSWGDHSLVVTRRHPDNVERAIGWLVVEPLAAAGGLARKLPHYGKYSYLAFQGEEPTNVLKGQWPTGDSPLFVDLRGGDQRGTALPELELAPRSALVDLPPVFSQGRLMAHVEFLASPALEGRGAGSPGLERAARYIADQFAAAGLTPAGEDGSFYQRFALDEGPEGEPVELINVVGVLPGSRESWADQAVVVGAHYDHLGLGWPDVHEGDQGRIHPGADDNASGVAILLELAKVLAEGDRPQRSLVFVAFSGEEAGRVGSRSFVEHPVGFDRQGIRAMINLDTVGRLEDRPVSVLGTGTADEWQHIFRGASYVTGVESRNIPESVEASDQLSFIAWGIPGVQIFTRAHGDYHRPSDTVDGIDGEGLVKVATLVREALTYLVGREEALTVTIAAPGADDPSPPPAGGGSSGRRVRFGTVPDFAFPGPGVRVEEVSAGSPAERAGFQAGDILLRIDDAEVTDLRSYSQILRTLEPGQRVQATVLRQGRELVLQVTVETR